MLTDLFNAFLVAGLPMFILSFALVSWALHGGQLTGETVKQLQGSIASLSKAQKEQAQHRQADPALRHWFRFGSGFYGLVALYTWLLIETDDLVGFFMGLTNLLINVNPGALIGLLVELFVESIMNFVVAITWPAYWLQASSTPWLFLGAGYAGYWLGIKGARRASRHQRFNETVQRVMTLGRGSSYLSSNRQKKPPKQP